MGQRLVITIHAFNEDIATIYYHWSAYTEAALYRAERIVNQEDLLECTNKYELLYKLIRSIEKDGGGISGTFYGHEFQTVMYKYQTTDFKRDADRNEGLISITEHGMYEAVVWADGKLKIDFDEQYVYNDVINFFYNIEEYNVFRSEVGLSKVSMMDVPEIDCNPTEIRFDQLEDALKNIENAESEVQYNGIIYQLIK